MVIESVTDKTGSSFFMCVILLRYASTSQILSKPFLDAPACGRQTEISHARSSRPSMTSNRKPLCRRKALTAAGAVLLLSTAACGQIGDFGGPSVLSRGGARPGTRGTTPMGLIVTGGV